MIAFWKGIPFAKKQWNQVWHFCLWPGMVDLAGFLEEMEMAIKRKEMLFSFTVASSKGLVTGTRYRDRSCEVGFGGVVVSADSYKELIERVRQGSELGDWPRDALRSVLIKLGREMIGQGADSDVDEESICWHPIGEVVDGEGNSIGILEGGHDLPKPTYH